MSEGIEGKALIHTLVRLGKALSIETLAEGIEQQAELSVLLQEQCDSGQGFLFARPLEVADATNFLEDWDASEALMPDSEPLAVASASERRNGGSAATKVERARAGRNGRTAARRGAASGSAGRNATANGNGAASENGAGSERGTAPKRSARPVRQHS